MFETRVRLPTFIESGGTVRDDHCPALRLQPGALASGVKAAAWNDSATPLRSGWALGQGYYGKAE